MTDLNLARTARIRSLRTVLLAGTALLSTAMASFADPFSGTGFIPGTLVVARIQYETDTNPARASETYPTIFTDPAVSGIQGSIFLDSYRTEPFSPRLRSFPLTDLSAGGPIITTSFSSKSEGSLHLSVDGRNLTYMGYVGPRGSEGVSNSETTLAAAQLTGAPGPFFDRAVALVKFDGTFSVTAENNAYSGDNPRGAVTVDGLQFYMAGNSDSSENKTTPVTGPGLTIGARLGAPGLAGSIQLGTYFASDRPDESIKQHVKDNNWRGIGIFGGNLYVSKGSGGNGDDGVFQVLNGTADGLPTGMGNTIVQLLGDQATNPTTGATSPLTPFAFFFANSTTLYVADEGNPVVTTVVDGKGNPIIGENGQPVVQVTNDALAGLQKWVLDGGTWKLAYVLQDGLDLNEAKTVPGYPVQSFTTGLRNLTGKVNHDGTVTIYAITGQASSISNGEPDPTRLVAVTDDLDATSLPTDGDDRDRGDRDFDRDHGDDRGPLEKFITLQVSAPGEVFRGVAFAPSR
jgi:hypothetical protein